MIHRSMRPTVGLFDACPVPQHKAGNYILIAIQSFGLFLFAIITVCILVFPIPPILPKYLLVLPFAIFALISFFGVFEIVEELIKISKITHVINGSRRSEKQLIEGTYAGQPVWFSIASRPMSVNYAVKIDGQKALSLAEQMRKYLAGQMNNAGMKGYRILITVDALILSKSVMIVFQIKPKKTAAIFELLINAKNEIVEKFSADQELFPIFE